VLVPEDDSQRHNSNFHFSDEFADDLIDHHILPALSIDSTHNSSHVPTMYSDFLMQEKIFGDITKYLQNTALSDTPDSSWKDLYLDDVDS